MIIDLRQTGPKWLLQATAAKDRIGQQQNSIVHNPFEYKFYLKDISVFCTLLQPLILTQHVASDFEAQNKAIVLLQTRVFIVSFM